MPDNLPSTDRWIPPVERNMRKTVNIILLGTVAVGAITAFGLGVVPSIDEAVANIASLVQNTTGLLISAAVLAVTGFIITDATLPGGRLRRVLDQAYSSFIHKLTNELLNRDPISPLLDARDRAIELKSFYEENYKKFIGKFGAWVDQRDASVRESKDAADAATAALGEIKRLESKRASGKRLSIEEEEALAQWTDAASEKAYEAKEAQKTAETYNDAIAKMERGRLIMERLMRTAGSLVRKMEVDIKQTRSRYGISQDVDVMTKSMIGIMDAAKLKGLAKDAKDLVEQKFSASLAELDAVRTMAKPLLQEEDLTRLASLQDIIKSMDERSAMIEAPDDSNAMPALNAPGGINTAQNDFAALLLKK